MGGCELIMIIEKIKVKGFRIYDDLLFSPNCDTNILVGDNGFGKSTLLDVINMAISGRFNGNSIDKAISISDFNLKIREHFLKDIRNCKVLPQIDIELYFKDDDKLAKYKGTNNSLGLDVPGIKLEIKFDDAFSEEYKNRITGDEAKLSPINDIPLEYYKVSRHYFSGIPILQQTNPFRTFFVDGTKNGYSSYVGKYI